jgi:D-alanyl-D-alanine carboxypeptidase/D-alanyl-D-alanine-endopeptidase (penicillin-binding protein 4)
VYVDGPVEEGVLRGNLIVRGAADPTIGGHYDAATGRWKAEVDALHIFREWADSLLAAGISSIEGDIIGDDDVVDDVPLGEGWSWDDESAYYSAQLSGLSFNDNVIHMHVQADDAEGPARIRWDPINTDYVEIVNRTRTVHPDSSIEEGYHRRRSTNTIDVTTLIPRGQDDIEEITVENPTLFFAHVLRETLQNSGIAVAGRPVDVDLISIKPDYVGPHMRRVAVHTSRPLSDIVRMVNKPSQNLYADMLIKTLAAEFPRQDDELKPGSADLGIEVAMQTFIKAGIDTSRIQLADGSGLSRQNLVTPEMTVSLLKFMWSYPDDRVRTTFYDSLPVAGVEGTLRFRMRSGPANQNVRAKTGSLSNVSSLSGYVQAADGTPLAFAAMCNHYTTPSRTVRRAQDLLANALAGFRK